MVTTDRNLSLCILRVCCTSWVIPWKEPCYKDLPLWYTFCGMALLPLISHVPYRSFMSGHKLEWHANKTEIQSWFHSISKSALLSSLARCFMTAQWLISRLLQSLGKRRQSPDTKIHSQQLAIADNEAPADAQGRVRTQLSETQQTGCKGDTSKHTGRLCQPGTH